LGFTLVNFLLQLCDLLVNSIESVSISRAVRNGSDEGGIWVFEGLSTSSQEKQIIACKTPHIPCPPFSQLIDLESGS
jgi:hypothetical protein